MADKKISALTGATTPLAGTEVLPIVQGSATVKVAISNVTAGRDVSALSYAITGTSISSPIGTNTRIGQTAATPHQAGNAGSVALIVDDGGLATGVFVNNTFNGTYSSQEVEVKTAEGGVSGSTSRLKITKSGDVQVLTGNIIPGTAAKGVNFTANTPAAGMTSQLLNWYEEGTWTPTDASGAGLIFTGVAGTYIRAGKLVTLFGQLTYPSTVSAASAILGGIPFNSAINLAANINYSDQSVANLTYLSCNTTNIYLLTPGVNVINSTMSLKSLSFTVTYKAT